MQVNYSNEYHCCAYLYVDNFLDLPYFYSETYKHADSYHHVRLLIQDIQKDNQGLEHVEEDRTDRQTLQGLTILPKLDIY